MGEILSQSYRASAAIWDHTDHIAATRQVTAPRLNQAHQARQAGTRFRPTYPKKMQS